MEDSLEIIRQERGKHFDPGVVDAFFAGLEEILAVCHELQEPLCRSCPACNDRRILCTRGSRRATGPIRVRQTTECGGRQWRDSRMKEMLRWPRAAFWTIWHLQRACLRPPAAVKLPVCPEVRPAGEACQTQRDMGKALEAVAELGRRMLSSPDLPGLMLDAAELLACMLDMEFGAVGETSDDGKSIQLTLLLAGCESGVRLTQFHATSSEERDSLAAQTILMVRPIVIEDLEAEQRFHDPFLHARSIRTALSLPLLIDGNRAFGILGAYSTRRKSFSCEDRFLAETIANLVSMTIAPRRLKRILAQQCQLTAVIQSNANELVCNSPPNRELAGLAAASGYTDAAKDSASIVKSVIPQLPQGDRRKHPRRRYP